MQHLSCMLCDAAHEFMETPNEGKEINSSYSIFHTYSKADT